MSVYEIMKRIKVGQKRLQTKIRCLGRGKSPNNYIRTALEPTASVALASIFV